MGDSFCRCVDKGARAYRQRSKRELGVEAAELLDHSPKVGGHCDDGRRAQRGLWDEFWGGCEMGGCCERDGERMGVGGES